MTRGRVIGAALDPVLVPAGFAAGQHGHSDGSGSVIFCAGYDEFSDRYPTLPQANGQSRGMGACVDLTIDYDANGLVEIDLEGISVPDTLREVGRPGDADAADQAVNQPVDAALASLASVLTRLFDGSH
jgi:hypothetical protein